MSTLDIGRAPTTSSWLPSPWTVRSVRPELADTVTLELAPPDGGAVAEVSPRPGQFNMLWSFGIGEVAISISGVTDEGTSLLHTIRSVGAVTKSLCDTRDGDQIGVRGPFGTSWSIEPLGEEVEPVDLVVVAGGLGLAPLRPVVEWAAAHRDTLRRVTVLTGARSPDTLLYAPEFARWSDAGVDVRAIVDHGHASWNGPIGVVTQLLDRAVVDPERTFAMVCGPEVMMRLSARALVDRGVAAERVEVSLERNMQCGMGLCGHCQLSSHLLCRDGPVLRWPIVEPLVRVTEL